MMKAQKTTILTILFSLIVFSSPAYAHILVPIPNYFSRDSLRDAAIWMIVIILVQSLLLKWRIREISYSGSLWRSVLINIVFSAAVSLLLPEPGFNPFIIVQYSFISLIVSVPLLYFLYSRMGMSWTRSLRIGLLLTFVSYVAFIVLLSATQAVNWGAEILLDRYQISKWNDSQMLRASSGRIYASYFPKLGKFDYRFSYFDTKIMGWRDIGHINDIDAFHWDIEGDILAYTVGHFGFFKDNHKFLRIYSLPGNTQIHEISLSEFVKLEAGTDANFYHVKISPDRKKLAVLLDVGWVQGYRDRAGFSVLGVKFKLFILDTHTGRIIATVPRWASGYEAPCWLPDSGSVLFRSYRDEILYEGDISDKGRGKVYNADDTKDPRFASGLYKFDLAEGSVKWFGEGKYPRLDIANNSIIMLVNEGVRILDIATGRETITRIQGLTAGHPVIPSPDGRFLLCFIEGHAKEHYPVVVAPKDPNQRCAIDNNMAEKVVKCSWSSSVD
jgi:hypothetical protein